MKIVSWNVNGLEACRGKGFLKFIKETKPDIVCCQETKVSSKFQITIPGYTQIWNHGIRPGYSGTLVLTMREPLSHSLGFGIEKFDIEGRLITLEFEEYYVLNIYAPSIHENNGSDRPDYRREWDEALRNYVSTLLRACFVTSNSLEDKQYGLKYGRIGARELGKSKEKACTYRGRSGCIRTTVSFGWKISSFHMGNWTQKTIG